MKINAPAVVKSGGKWFIGFISDDKFAPKSQIVKLTDVKDISEYVTLKKFLKERSEDFEESDADDKLKILDVERCYILDKPIDLKASEWEKWWWSEYNKLCLDCEKTCKQSWRVTIVNCWKLQQMKV